MDKRIKKAIYNKFPKDVYTVYDSYDGGSCYIIAVKKNNTYPPYLDPFYKVNKKTTKITGFAPFIESELFAFAKKHPIDF